MTARRFVAILVIILVSWFASGITRADELTATVGKRGVVIPEGTFDFRYFPDEPVSVLSRSPLKFLMVVGDKTVLMEGSSFEKAKPSKVVLEPSKKAGTYDEHYTGISSVYVDAKKKEVLGFFHAEKPTGGKNKEGTHRFYATIGLAVSEDGGQTFKKIGPIICGPAEDPDWKGTAQGNADVSVCLDHTGKWLYAYYTEHSRKDPATGKTRSVITCMARSKVEDGARPGTWKKYYNGSFDEPGLGGKDSEVANCWAPQVTYIPEMKKYVMLGNRGCVGFYSSDDGIKWANPVILFKMDDVPMIGHEIAIHPCLHIEKASATEATGYVFYAYSPNYGHEKPKSSHHFVKQPITIKLSGTATPADGAEGLKKKLAGTKWVNSNKVSFEWTADGRFLHKGVEREWKVIDGGRVQVVFKADHVDTLVFNESFTEFKQLIKGGPDSLQGKRAKE